MDVLGAIRSLKGRVRDALYRTLARAFERWPSLLALPGRGYPGLWITPTFPLTLAGRHLRVPADNTRVLRRWTQVTVKDKFKEPETLAWVEDDLDDGSVFWDIGANVGNYCVLASVAHPGARVLAFEPEPSSFLSLCRLIHLNGLDITPYPFAISDRPGVDLFNLKGGFEAGLADHQLGRAVDQTGESFQPAFSVGAAVFSVDSLVYEHGLPCPTHVKIDVDGIEMDVLRGMRRALESGGIQSVLTEVTEEQARRDVEELLRSYGYRLSATGKSRTVYRLIFERVEAQVG